MTHQDVVLGFANRSDATTIAQMSRELIESGLGWSYRPQRIGELIADVDTVALVARERGRVAGFTLTTFGDERAHLVLLAVRRQSQRRGIARRMIQWIVESAAVAGAGSVHVELRAHNVAAIALYRTSGFAESLRMPGYYRGREDAIRMVRVLRSPGTAIQLWRPPSLNRP
jgi:ribosomal-protein-alanine N-acetyltransferase